VKSIDRVPSIIGIILIKCKESGMRRCVALVAASALVTTALAGCNSSGSDVAGVQVVATTTVLGDLVRNVVGDAADVEVLMPIGVDPHDFEASSQQVAAIERADLVVANGLGLEGGLSDILEAAVGDGVNVWEVGPDIGPRPFTDTPGPGAGLAVDEGLLDPHFWLDPLRDADAARQLGQHLTEVAPDHDWMTAAEAYAFELESANEEIVGILSVVPEGSRKLITNHQAFGYFSDRYGFETIGTVVPGGATLANPSSAELAALVTTMEEQHIPAIFTETVEPDVLAQAVAAEVGSNIKVVELYTGSLGEPGSEADTLIGMLVTNARRIAEALGRS
jgi:zinc/manganese transport system substrate-binding protein